MNHFSDQPAHFTQPYKANESGEISNARRHNTISLHASRDPLQHRERQLLDALKRSGLIVAQMTAANGTTWQRYVRRVA